MPQLTFRTALARTTTGLLLWFRIPFAMIATHRLRAATVSLAANRALLGLTVCMTTAYWKG